MNGSVGSTIVSVVTDGDAGVDSSVVVMFCSSVVIFILSVVPVVSSFGAVGSVVGSAANV